MSIKEPSLNINGELVDFRDTKKIIEVLTKEKREKIDLLKKDIVSIDEQKVKAKKFEILANKLRDSVVTLTTQDMDSDLIFKQMIPSPVGMDIASFIKYMDVHVKPEDNVKPTNISAQPIQIAVAERWQSKTFPSKIASVTEPASSTDTTSFKAGDFKILVQNNAITTVQDFSSKVSSVVEQNAANKFVPGKFYINNNIIELRLGDSLNKICDKINNLGIGVKATIEDNPDPSGFQYKLFIRSEKIGAENNFLIDDPNSVFSQLNKNGDNLFFDKYNEYKTVSLKPGDTLKAIADKINKFDKDTNLRADVFQLSKDQYSLILKSLSTGIDNKFQIIDNSITLNGSNNGTIFGSIFNKDSPVTTGKQASIVSAQDAKLIVDGAEMQGPTNLFEVYPGIRVTLKSTSPTTMTFEVKHDINGIFLKINDVVEKYNMLKQIYDDALPTDRKAEKSQLHETYMIKKTFGDFDDFMAGLENTNIGLSRGQLELDKKDGDKTIKYEYSNMIIVDKMKLIEAIEESPSNILKTFDLTYDSSSPNFVKKTYNKIGVNNQSLGNTKINLDLKVDLDKVTVKSHSSIGFSDVNDIFDVSGVNKSKFKSGVFWINDSAVTLTSNMSLFQVRDAINSVSNMSRISASITTNTDGSYLSFTQYSGNYKASDDFNKFQGMNIFDPGSVLQGVFSSQIQTDDFDVSSLFAVSNYITPGTTLKINSMEIIMPTSQTLADLEQAINDVEYKTGVRAKSSYNTFTGKYYINFENRTLNEIVIDNSTNAIGVNITTAQIQQKNNYFFDTSQALKSIVKVNGSTTNKHCILTMNGSDLKSGSEIKVMNNDNSKIKLDGVEVLFTGEDSDNTSIEISQGLGSVILENLDKILKIQSNYKSSTIGILELNQNITKRKEDINKTLKNLEDRLKHTEKQITQKWAKVHSYFDAQNSYNDLVDQLYKRKSDD